MWGRWTRGCLRGRRAGRRVSWRLGWRCCSRRRGIGSGAGGCVCSLRAGVWFGSAVLVIEILCSCDRLGNFFCILINLSNKRSHIVGSLYYQSASAP